MEPEPEYELSEYEKLRLARIKRNQAKLAALGLDKPWFEQTTPNKKKAKTKAISRKKTPPSKPGTERRSNRLSKSSDTKFYQLSPDFDEEVMVEQRASTSPTEDDEEPFQAEVSVRQVRRRVNLNRDDYSVSEGDMKNLRGIMDVEIFLSKFREFLRYQDKISDSNERSVMRQVRKLALGEGIRYESAKYGWPEGKYFRKGEKITLMHDIVELMDEAVECENKWGRDRGNGWLLSHPLKKMIIFQMFCLKNPSFLASKCKIREYVEGGEEYSCGNDEEEEKEKEASMDAEEEDVGEEATSASSIAEASTVETDGSTNADEDASKGGTDVDMSAKPSKRSTNNKYVGARVAKTFDQGLFFGTITNYDDEANFWFVEYDDGDCEEFDKKTLNAAFRLYNKNAAKDPKNTCKSNNQRTGKRTATSLDKSANTLMTPVGKKKKVASAPIGSRRSPRCVAGIY